VILSKAISEGEKTRLKSFGGILQQVGAFLGIYCFTVLTARYGRRISFLLGWRSPGAA